MTKLNIIKDEDEPWYKDGLYFKCTGCGKCCSGSPGYVWLEEKDIKRLCKHLEISRAEFLKKYTKTVNRRISLRDDTKDYACIFLKEGKYCSVYDARPTQCKTYPFWIYNIASKRQWDQEGKHCEGINHPDAKKISAERIKTVAAVQSGLLPEDALDT
ncbi:zinc/iron-chelating domain-containing protein [Candidatus Aerophobetes bacterium]|uniref:Zinc/iron-chelating domain-containing protein n=1 Tax=Aerophobetes bacterium TaxID=2030807 RepID=A0A2A4YLM4_UNCAE|nr:MAG: zinc/iron-chelating domain-containing protein [Candidatus Aerophobetes bacterium]